MRTYKEVEEYLDKAAARAKGKEKEIPEVPQEPVEEVEDEKVEKKSTRKGLKKK